MGKNQPPSKGKKPYGYWNDKGKVIEAASKCFGMKDFYLRFRSAYKSCKRNGWLNEVSKIVKSPVVSSGERSILKYLEANSIKHIHRKRFKGLRDKRQLEYDFYLPSLKTIIEFHGKQHYMPIGKFGGEKEFKGIQRRDKLKRLYATNRGFNYIEISYTDLKNIDKILSNIISNKGNQSKIYFPDESKLIGWTKERCFREVKKYNSAREFKRGNGSAYNSCQRNGWLIEISTFFSKKRRPRNYLTKDKIREIASRYDSLSIFIEEQYSVYQKSCQLGIRAEVTSNMKRKRKA